jgi:hypothetical protein
VGEAGKFVALVGGKCVNQKMKRGLGVKILRVVNLSLLVKLRWRLIQYGESIGNLAAKGGRKDIMPLEEVVGSNWCNDNIIRKVANDSQTNLGGINATFHQVF